jgi:hypothetical protein
MSLEKIAAATRAEALQVIRVARELGVTVKIAAVTPLDPKKALKVSAGSAWYGSPPKPKSRPPSTRPGASARSTPTAPGPSKKQYYKDTVQAMDPSYGQRLAVQG